jgi:ABC-type oligopeptide transport system substrate-binding subunit
MKKILCGIAAVLAMAFVTSCGCNQTVESTTVEEEEVVEVVDSTAVAVDTLEVVAE